MKGMTTQNPFARQEKPPDDAVFLNRSIRIGGTAGNIPAACGKMGRNSHLIEPD
jgi:hypothetical protein